MTQQRPLHGPDKDMLPVRPEPLGVVCRTNADLFPDASAVITTRETVSWGTLYERSLQVAAGLSDLGVTRGARVAVLAEPQMAWFEIIHALPWLGSVLVPVNLRLSVDELTYVLRDSRAEVLVAERGYLDQLGPALEGLPDLRHILELGASEPPIGIPYEQWRLSQSSAFSTGTLLGSDASIQMYTSGTTGRPKGALLSNYYLTEYARMPVLQEEEFWGLKEGETPLNYSPMFHLTGIASHFHPAVRGVGTVLLDRFDPAEILRLSRAYRSPRIGGVAAMLRALLNEVERTDAEVPNFRYCTYGADPMPLELRARLIETFNCRFVQYYGMTESALVTCLTAEDHVRGGDCLRSVGRAMPGVDIRIMDSSGKVLDVGELGEIAVRSVTMMDGYWNLPQKTSKAFRDGWYLSGDGGYLDENGYLYLKDRIKDMIISGGENIYPAEIEKVLYQHPDVELAAVIGIPDERWGEVPKAFITAKNDGDLDVDDLRTYVASKLAGYKRPKYYEVIDDMPLTGSNKIQKSALRTRNVGE